MNRRKSWKRFNQLAAGLKLTAEGAEDAKKRTLPPPQTAEDAKYAEGHALSALQTAKDAKPAKNA